MTAVQKNLYKAFRAQGDSDHDAYVMVFNSSRKEEVVPRAARDTVEWKDKLNWVPQVVGYPLESGFVYRGNALRYVYLRLLDFDHESAVAQVMAEWSKSGTAYDENTAEDLVQGVLDCRARYPK